MINFFNYIKFCYKSTSNHGVHSPFVYDLITFFLFNIKWKKERSFFCIKKHQQSNSLLFIEGLKKYLLNYNKDNLSDQFFFKVQSKDNLIELIRNIVLSNNGELNDNQLCCKGMRVIHVKKENRKPPNSYAMRLLVEFDQCIGHTGQVLKVPYSQVFFAPKAGRTTHSLMLADNVKDKYSSTNTRVVEVWLLMCGEKEVPDANDKFRDNWLRKELVLTSFFPTERPVGIGDDVNVVTLIVLMFHNCHSSATSMCPNDRNHGC